MAGKNGYIHEEQDRTLSRTSNYNETVRANNNRLDSDNQKSVKRLPKGRTAAAQYKGRKGSGGRS